MLKKIILSLLIFNSAYIPTMHPTLDSKFLPYNFGWRSSLFGILGITALGAGFYYGWFKWQQKNYAKNNVNFSQDICYYSRTGYSLSRTHGEEFRTDRIHNDDAVSKNTTDHIFGVYDGNGKSKQELIESLGMAQADIEKANGINFESQWDPHEVSEYIATRLPGYLIGNMNKKETIQQQFKEIHQGLRPHCTIGSASTAVIAHIKGNTLHVAHIGDSAAFHIKNNSMTIEEVSCTKDVNGKTIESATAKFNLGAPDFDSTRVYVAPPQPLSDGDVIVLASDGVTSYLTPREMLDIVQDNIKKNSVTQIAKIMVQVAEMKAKNDFLCGQSYKLYKVDDQTAVVIRYSTK